MNIFEELGSIYTEIDRRYAVLELESRAKGYNKKEELYAQKRQINDRAYFLFMFTRLEDHIRECSNTLIDTKMRTMRDWRFRRSWEILSKSSKGDKLHFMDRVAFLTSKGHQDYNTINKYYKQRNDIAHGDIPTTAIVMPQVIIDMKRLYAALR